MLLPDEGAVCDLQKWPVRWHRQFAWREYVERWRIRFRIRATTDPEKRLAQILLDIQARPPAQWGDHSPLMERLEAQLIRTNDVEVRKLLSTYLSEP